MRAAPPLRMTADEFATSELVAMPLVHDRRVRTTWASLTRRWFLLASATATLLARPAAAARGEPFSDGTRFADDGTGWVD